MNFFPPTWFWVLRRGGGRGKTWALFPRCPVKGIHCPPRGCALGRTPSFQRQSWAVAKELLDGDNFLFLLLSGCLKASISELSTQSLASLEIPWEVTGPWTAWPRTAGWVPVFRSPFCFVTDVCTMTHITAQAKLSVYKIVDNICEELFFFPRTPFVSVSEGAGNKLFLTVSSWPLCLFGMWASSEQKNTIC